MSLDREILRRHERFWKGEGLLCRRRPWTPAKALATGKACNERLSPDMLRLETADQDAPLERLEKGLPLAGDALVVKAPVKFPWTEATMGCPVKFAPESGCAWATPFVDDLSNLDRLRLRPDNPWLAKLGGCDVTTPIDGHSMVPLITHARPERDDAVVFSEYHGYCSPSDMYMVIKGDYKYCRYLLEPGELYKLREDPAEEHNLIRAPSYHAIRAELECEIRARVDIEDFAAHIRTYNAQRQTVAEAIAASPIISQWNLDQIREHREKRHEPWWDGGAHCAQWEKHLHGDPSDTAAEYLRSASGVDRQP